MLFEGEQEAAFLIQLTTAATNGQQFNLAARLFTFGLEIDNIRESLLDCVQVASRLLDSVALTPLISANCTARNGLLLGAAVAAAAAGALAAFEAGCGGGGAGIGPDGLCCFKQNPFAEATSTLPRFPLNAIRANTRRVDGPVVVSVVEPACFFQACTRQLCRSKPKVNKTTN